MNWSGPSALSNTSCFLSIFFINQKEKLLTVFELWFLAAIVY